MFLVEIIVVVFVFLALIVVWIMELRSEKRKEKEVKTITFVGIIKEKNKGNSVLKLNVRCWDGEVFYLNIGTLGHSIVTELDLKKAVFFARQRQGLGGLSEPEDIKRIIGVDCKEGKK